jgi:hypothetical protein
VPHLAASWLQANNALERTVNHRGRTLLAMDGVLADAEWALRPAAQLDRYGAHREYRHGTLQW